MRLCTPVSLPANHAYNKASYCSTLFTHFNGQIGQLTVGNELKSHILVTFHEFWSNQQ